MVVSSEKFGIKTNAGILAKSTEKPNPSKDDMVNHPPHYQTKSGMEAIDVIDAFTEELVGREATYTSNVLKYTLRWMKKDGIRDLKKARFYLDRLIRYLESKESE